MSKIIGMLVILAIVGALCLSIQTDLRRQDSVKACLATGDTPVYDLDYRLVCLSNFSIKAKNE